MSLLNPKLPPYMRKKSPPGGFFGKPVPPNSPYHLTMSIPIFTVQSTTNTTTTGSSPSNNGSPVSPKSPHFVNLPRGLVPMEHQVAGHTFQVDNPNEMGLLKRSDGVVLKPAGKALCGAREIEFYESLTRQSELPEHLASLRDLVPIYHGSETLSIEGREVTFIKLEDLTDKMLEPCAMDVKIGRRTWDPLATQEKREAEESKYVACKQGLGFCVPGFQVHSVRTGRVKRFGKEYGKKLNEQTIKEAFRIFLNAADNGLCRPLLMQFLSCLWAIQSWARSQTSLRIYSSSVLFVYDARRLREVLEANKRRPANVTPPSPGVKLNGNLTPTGNWTNESFKLNRSTSSTSSTSSLSSSHSLGSPQTGCNNGQQTGEPIQSFKKIQRNHSVNNNYDQDIKEMQVDYVLMLDNLRHQNEERRKDWATVRMIDFAHTFPSEDCTEVDENYLFGIENVVKIFEEFLQECDQ